MATSEQFVQKCLAELGDEYEWGAEATPGTAPEDTEEWDCSGLVWTKLQELGIDDCPRSSTQQLEWCQQAGTTIPYETGVQTRGALLLKAGHVAVSLGDGTTIEAYGEDRGVIIGSASGRTMTHAAYVPGLDYAGLAPDEGGARDYLEVARERQRESRSAEAGDGERHGRGARRPATGQRATRGTPSATTREKLRRRRAMRAKRGAGRG